jgi:hypothetical protein
MPAIRILDVTDLATFDRMPPCADPGFDHRSCDYWEDAERGSKAARLSWLEPGSSAGRDAGSARPRPANPFLADLEAARPAANPFATARPANPFLTPGDTDDDAPLDNPFAPRPVAKSAVPTDASQNGHRRWGVNTRMLSVTPAAGKNAAPASVSARYSNVNHAPRA